MQGSHKGALFSRACLAPAVALAVALGACERADPGTGPGTAPDQGPLSEVQQIEMNVSPDSNETGLVRGFDVTVSLKASIVAEYWTEGEPRWRVETGVGTEHRVLLGRLLPARPYQYEIRAEMPNAVPAIERGTFATDALPSDLEAVTLTQTGEPTASLVMLEIRPPTFQGYVAVDSQARIVWYYRTDGSSWSWARRSNGNFVLLDTADELTEITPDGQIVTNITRTRAGGQVIHHDVIATPQDTFYFLTREWQSFKGTLWGGDAIWEWDPQADVVVQRWSAFDHLSPASDLGPRSHFGDWLHGNSLHVGVSGNVLFSSAFLSQVIAITPDFSGLAWRMGGPNATIIPDSVATFSFQHTAAEVAKGRVVMFDNRRDVQLDGQAYSRGLEVAFDPSSGEATVAWQFRPPNDNFSTIMSSARRLPNGNTVVAFAMEAGGVGSSGPIEVYEVTQAGSIVWHLVVEGPLHMYRATPFEHIAGEVVIGSPIASLTAR